MTDFVPEKPSVARVYCPGCEPHADILLEILEVRWCESHSPARDGSDDHLLITTETAVVSAEAGGEDNRRWCEALHGRRSRRSSTRLSKLPRKRKTGQNPRSAE